MAEGGRRGSAADGGATAPVGGGLGAPDPGTPRPIIERVGLAFIALVLVLLFGVVALAAWLGGEPFLAAMGAIGCLMTAWAGGQTLLRG